MKPILPGQLIRLRDVLVSEREEWDKDHHTGELADFVLAHYSVTELQPYGVRGRTVEVCVHPNPSQLVIGVIEGVGVYTLEHGKTLTPLELIEQEPV